LRPLNEKDENLLLLLLLCHRMDKTNIQKYSKNIDITEKILIHRKKEIII